jgi:methyl-CpG-binding domain protein 4
MILDTGDGGEADALARMEDSEEEYTATQSTWKGCESDDEHNVGPSGTPKGNINVVIYTPSKTWIPVDGSASSQPSPPMEDLIPEAGDDNTSIFSMTRYGSMDWDHTGDELDEMEFTPKTTRKGSTASPDNRARIFYELDPVTPQNKRGSTSSTSTSGKKTSSLQRDSQGRFAPKNSSSVSSFIKPKSRRTSASSNSGTLTLKRDVHGRFAPKDGTPGNTAAKRRASMGSSVVDKAPRPLLRDKHGKFAPNPGASTITPAKRRASLGSSDNPLGSLERDSKGRFAPKKETPIPPPKPLAKRRFPVCAGPEDTPVFTRDENGQFTPKQTTVQSPKNSMLGEDSESPSPEAIMDDDEPPKTKSALKPAKAKKASAKSPYFIHPTPPISPEITRKSQGQKASKASTADEPKTPRKKNGNVPASPGSEKKRLPGKTISCIPFPPLSAPHFGLIQEKLAHDPFRLLIAVTFLIRTHGKHAIPVFFELMEKYPTPESLVAADKEEIVPIIRHLGLQNQRASTYQMYAKIWLEDPPTKGKRYLVRGYPNPEAGRDVKKGEILSDEDERHAWEIGHMTQGPYAIDSWRIFCRDKLRSEADGWNGEGRGEGFQPEWMRVVPEDKELRAYLRWMWLKEGFEWDPFTGDKEAARPELMRAAMEGRIAWDDQGGMRILDEPMSASPSKSDSDGDKSQVSTPRVRSSTDLEDELA